MPTSVMDRDLALEAVRVTEAAALAASSLMGRGDDRAAEEAAVGAMHEALNALAIQGRVVIGEPDGMAKLFRGEMLGAAKSPAYDIALDPLEGATITAKGGPNAIACVAMGRQGSFLAVPEIYMNKIAIGPGLPADLIDLDAGPEENLRRLAEAKGAIVSDLVVCILDRPRHDDLIGRVREAGARIMLITDGDVSGAVASLWPNLTGVDLFLGSGGAPEGVLAAAAIKCLGGQMQGRLLFRSEADKAKGRDLGITDTDRKYSAEDMAQGEVMFAATGVTSGAMLTGVRRFHNGAVTHSMVMRSKTGTFRFIEAHHDFTRKQDFAVS